MINPSDLRVGNFLQEEGGRMLRVMQLYGIVAEGIMLEDGMEEDGLAPIPLTVDILKLNGFQDVGCAYSYRKRTFHISGIDCFPCGDCFVVDAEHNYKKGTDRVHKVISYVHEF